MGCGKREMAMSNRIADAVAPARLHGSGRAKKGILRMNYTPEQEQMWNHVIEVFRTQIQKASFDAWVKPMKLFAVTSNEVLVTFEDAMSQSVMVGRYQKRVEILVRSVFGMEYSLKIIEPREAERRQQLASETALNPKYTFETFVTGPSNASPTRRRWPWRRTRATRTTRCSSTGMSASARRT